MPLKLISAYSEICTPQSSFTASTISSAPLPSSIWPYVKTALIFIVLPLYSTFVSRGMEMSVTCWFVASMRARMMESVR